MAIATTSAAARRERRPPSGDTRGGAGRSRESLAGSTAPFIGDDTLPPMTPWLFDGHLDLAYLGVRGRDLRAESVPDGSGCVTLPALRAGDVRVAMATIFTEAGGDVAVDPSAYRAIDDVDGASRAGRLQLAWYEAMERSGAIRIVRTRQDLLPPPHSDEPLRVILLMECADPIRDASEAAWWVAAGVRVVGLAWARGSRAAGGNGAPGPLTPHGRALVEELDALGTIHDLSHLSDEGADELLDLTHGPVIASHSNCRALVGDNQRHIADRHIAAVGARGGAVGLNLFAKFLRSDRRPTIADCVLQIERVAEIMGHCRGIALGSDMDGGFDASQLPEGLDHPSRLGALADALSDRGFSDAEVQRFAHDNWMRIVTAALR